MKPFKIVNVVGARPNFIKMAPIQRAMAENERLEPILVHTGQHYDQKMSRVFFEDLELPRPEVYLGVGSGSHAQQTASIMTAFESTLQKLKPDLVLVVGDVNSTLACTLVACKMGIRVAHVEAGLRSFDRSMPEEINRIVTDSLADLLFVTEEAGMENLKREGIAVEKTFLVGNVMIDSLVRFREKARTTIELESIGVGPGHYSLVTLHRPGNVDCRESLVTILEAFSELDRGVRLLFPVHPRTRKRFEEFGLLEAFASLPHLKMIEPLGYLAFLRLMEEARLVITDSGGIQEETTYLGIPCLTLRPNTERPVTISLGTNQLVALDKNELIAKAAPILAGTRKRGKIPPLWDGATAGRIVATLVERLA